MQRRTAAPYVLLIPAVAVLVAALGYPIGWQIITSLQEYGLAQQFGQPPTFVWFDNYVKIFGQGQLWSVVARSIAFCLINAFLTVAIGLGFALLMRAVPNAVRIFLQVCLRESNTIMDISPNGKRNWPRVYASKKC